MENIWVEIMAFPSTARSIHQLSENYCKSFLARQHPLPVPTKLLAKSPFYLRVAAGR